MIERWSRDQVLALAPDASSQKAAAGVSSPAKWSSAGVAREALWGECKGSGAKPYRACVDLQEPAYRCSCPSRKFPCKHALGLLLLWSADGVPGAEEPADWVEEWLDQRRERAAKQTAKLAEKVAAIVAEEAAGGSDASPGSGADDRRARQREERVDAGLADLERWLGDQIAHGIANARQSALADWDELSKRLVDAQAPGVAGLMTGLSRVFRHEDWPARLLSEYALAHLLAVAHRRSAELPRELRDTVRSRVGFTMPKENVLARPPVRDHWQVIGTRDEERDRLLSRRVWLHGRATGRTALILSFAPLGQPLDSSLVLGTTVDADVCFYPGSAPLRALVAARHSAADPSPMPPRGVRAASVPRLIADILTCDPWTDSWPVILSDVVLAKADTGWHLADYAHGDSAGYDGAGRNGTGQAGRDHADLDHDRADHASPGHAGHDRDCASPGHADRDRDHADLSGHDRAGRDNADHERAGSGDEEGNALPILPSVGDPWRLAAVSGGQPVTVAAEWTPDGLRLLSTWDEQGQVVVL
ncbi:SWIM zinc finger family protein [Acrocarpospora phusangensis]|uniref:SWIM zinc finger family protein n=1 Tax=Acrocarpospora phusangensis TaxID=1070424 RepID=UPI001EF1E59B|nr:SWIM zinc finger family protein [Acrocarpospora phusangensis]